MSFYSNTLIPAEVGGLITSDGTDAVLSNGADFISGADGGGTCGHAADGRFSDYYATAGFHAVAAMAIGDTTSSTKGLFLRNTTAATVGAPSQRSPTIEQGGNAWSTTAVASKYGRWRTYVYTESGGANPNRHLFFDRDLDDGNGFLTLLSFQSNDHINIRRAGSLIWNSDGLGNVGLEGSNRPDYGYFKTAVLIDGDAGAGVASNLTLTGATLAIDAGEAAATLAKVPTGYAAAQAGWIKFYTGTQVAVWPYFIPA